MLTIKEDKILLDNESKKLIESFNNLKDCYIHLKNYTPCMTKVYKGGSHIALISTMTNKRVLLITE